MKKCKDKKCGRKIKIAAISILLVVILLCSGCFVFLIDCYEADTEAIDAFANMQTIECSTDGAYTVFKPKEATVGFIFYPGAKVEHEAYLPLMKACASEGILCVLVEMPLYFPLINQSAADGIQEAYSEIERWYIGGHSLGGYSAANYISTHHDEYDGLVLLAAYSGAELSSTEIDVLTIYGSKDTIMNHERYNEGLAKLPSNYTELVIDGGCHAYFGVYDGQDGSEAVGITNEEQILLTAKTIREFIEK